MGLFKVVQLAVFAYQLSYFFNKENFSESMYTIATANTNLMVAVPILLFGQLLNFAVWYQIKIDGVCYGIKYKRHVPWCTAFPYNVFSHPQYLGAILTCWGLFLTLSPVVSEWYMLAI